MKSPTETHAWDALKRHQRETAGLTMRAQFSGDPTRFNRLSLSLGDLLFDYSKHKITENTLQHLFALANEMDLTGWRKRLFAGEAINDTEGRAVFHIALRHQGQSPMTTGGKDVMPDVRAVLQKMRAFVEAVHSGAFRGHTGARLTDIVNIGIGGSDLGPAMAAQALRPYWVEGMRAHFVSNIDGAHLGETLRDLDPERTLFVIASKSFTTQETLTNARSARQWLVEKLGDDKAVAKHFVAVSTQEKKVVDFGIDLNNMFEFWDWVGGRYSLCSAIGLPLALVMGMDNFEGILKGAATADQHFLTAPFEENIPVIMGMLGIWYHNFLGAASTAILPYDQSLSRFAAYFQQGDMESNGKSVDRNGQPITNYTTGPIVWGEPGTNGQHAFFQLLHQGTRLVPADFLAPCQSHHPMGDHHDILLSNFLAQSKALMLGQNEAEARKALIDDGANADDIKKLLPHKVFPGDRPSSTFLFPKLTPDMLGTLIALYEHKIFVQGVIWNINSFDQWGVELGKTLAKGILPELKGEAEPGSHDSSTKGLMDFYKTHRKN